MQAVSFLQYQLLESSASDPPVSLTQVGSTMSWPSFFASFAGGSDTLGGVTVTSTVFLSANALLLPGNARVMVEKKNGQALHSVRECCNL